MHTQMRLWFQVAAEIEFFHVFLQSAANHN